MSTAHEAELTEVRQAAANDVVKVRQGFDETRELEKAGLDDDGIAEARRLYAALPEGKRPAKIGEWVKELKPETVPRTLKDYFKPAEPADTEAAQEALAEPVKRTVAKPPAKVDQGRGKAPVTPNWDTMTDEQYAAAIQADAMSLLQGA